MPCPQKEYDSGLGRTYLVTLTQKLYQLKLDNSDFPGPMDLTRLP
jgi:hypothetical protein